MLFNIRIMLESFGKKYWSFPYLGIYSFINPIITKMKIIFVDNCLLITNSLMIAINNWLHEQRLLENAITNSSKSSVIIIQVHIKCLVVPWLLFHQIKVHRHISSYSPMKFLSMMKSFNCYPKIFNIQYIYI